MAVASLVQWYGGNRMHAERVGQLIGKQDLIGVPFAGGLSELPFLNARQILVNDKHEDLLNLCRVLSMSGKSLQQALRECVYHPGELKEAQEQLRHADPFNRAKCFFIINWMTRCSGGTAKGEEGSLAMRFTASGGSSIARWQSAIDGLGKWSELLRTKCECTCLDWFAFHSKWNDRAGHALYLDPPWIDAGDDYLHKFTIVEHTRLSNWVNKLEKTRVVVRHSDCHDYRSLYPADKWEWFPIDAKNQAGNATGEVLIRNLV